MACELCHLSQSLNTRSKSEHPYLEQVQSGRAVANNECLCDTATRPRHWLRVPYLAIAARARRPTLYRMRLWSLPN
jgi:hypothetical protein